MRISDWSSDVCSSDLRQLAETLGHEATAAIVQESRIGVPGQARHHCIALVPGTADGVEHLVLHPQHPRHQIKVARDQLRLEQRAKVRRRTGATRQHRRIISRHRSEEHTSELQSLMRISYAVFCLKKKKKLIKQQNEPNELTKAPPIQ